MSEIISKTDERYKHLDYLFNKYDYDNIKKLINGYWYYFIPYELVKEVYSSDRVYITMDSEDPCILTNPKINWVSCYYLADKLLKSTGLTTQEYFDLLVLHINETEDRPKCPCGNYVSWSGGVISGYGSKGHPYEESICNYCSPECRQKYNIEGLVNFATSEEGREQSRQTCINRNSDPKSQADMNYYKLVNNNENLYFYLAIAECEGVEYLKFGCCNNLSTRYNFAKYLDGYKTIHEVFYADALTVASLEYSLKELFDYSEYVEFDQLHTVIEYLRKFKNWWYSKSSKRIKSITRLNQSEEVFDLTTEHFAHNYALGNKCIVHNCGKSLFLQGEAVNFIEQGKRVHYLTLGDLNELDMAIRMTCMISHKSQREVESDIIGNFECYKDLFSNYLGLTVVPSGYVKVTDYVEWMIQRSSEYDVLMIDYDSNFANDQSLSSYDKGGETYDAISRLSRLGKLVFVASQPKISYFGEEILPMDAAGESSRKQHISDVILTIGRRWDSAMKMGYFNIAKNRRGENAEQPYIGTSEGLFYECSDVLYAKYRNHKGGRRLYSLQELKDMDIADSLISDALSDSIDQHIESLVQGA